MEFKSIESDIEDLKIQLDKLNSRVKSELSLSTETPKKLIPYPLNPNGYSANDLIWHTFKYYNGDSNRTPIYATYKEALGALDKVKILVDNIHNRNLEIIKFNSVIVKRIHDFFISLGFSDTRIEFSGTGKKRHSYSCTAYWYSDILSNISIDDTIYKQFEEWYNNISRDIDTYYKRIEVEKSKKKLEEDKRDNLNKAIQYLIKNNKVLGKDFDLTNAPYKARDVRFNELVEEQKGIKQTIKCCSECNSWIAGEPRCECGNTRVYWTFIGDDFESVNIYATGD